jgi:hypothetical protein
VQNFSRAETARAVVEALGAQSGERQRVIAYDRFRPGVTMETQPPPAEEVANCSRLWKAGVVREKPSPKEI